MNSVDIELLKIHLDFDLEGIETAKMKNENLSDSFRVNAGIIDLMSNQK